MSETAADEQDLAKALDSVANAVSNFDSTSAPSTDSSSTGIGGVGLPPVVPVDSPVAPAMISHSFATSTDPDSATDTTPPVSPLVQPLSDDGNVAVANATADSDGSVSSDKPADDTDDRGSLSASDSTVPAGPLADIKNDALNELRPLVNKLNVSPEEKFDTYLLLIRSTDDTSLIAPAHEAAKSIQDEAKRAEALLDIIKEIDYLSRQDKENS